ncbi:hypothetical protein [Mycobacteroides abscessus]|uniref:hypothetical protein n=1 Tax=Mycobacteroides abscessus TaxID=36809 RepID=UPI0010422741|nr:hypothetical protein [Mycobacteroides abscessus]
MISNFWELGRRCVEADFAGRSSSIKSCCSRAVSAVSIGTLIALALLAMPSCGFPDRSREAAKISTEIRGLPGVHEAESHYDTSFDGGAHFNLDVVVTKDIPADQAARIGEVFVERVAAAKFNRFDVKLNVEYGPPGRASDYGYQTSATFSFSFNELARQAITPSAAEVSDSLRTLTRIAQNPAVGAVALTQPNAAPQSSSSDSPRARGLLVVLADQVTQSQISALTDVFPELDKAQWVILGGSEPSYRPNTYQIVGRAPTLEIRDLWNRIDKQALSVRGRISANTEGTPSDLNPAATIVDFSLGGGPDADERLDEATRTVIPSLVQLPGPTLLRFTWANETASVMIGGCQPPGKTARPPTPTEKNLRSLYERC